jgi:Bacterial Ig-like domain (group 3)
VRIGRLGLTTTVAVAVASLFALAAPLGVTMASAAGTAPPWEADANAAPPYGNLVFFDANGNEVTSGTNLSNPFAYAVATTAADAKATKATLYFADPKSGEVPGLWNNTTEAGPTTFSPASSIGSGTPADVSSFAPANPVVNASAADITSWIPGNPSDSTTGYADTIEVRLQDSGAGGAGNNGGSTYWETDIGYNTTSSPITLDGTTVPADGWAQLFPFVTPTTTTLAAAPASPQSSGTAVTLTATETPAAAGTVQFFDNGIALGSPVAVNGSGVATDALSGSTAPAVGSHSYTASFVPTIGDESGANTTSATVIGGSTSIAVPYTISAAVTPTSTALSSSVNPSTTGQSVTFTATVTPAPDGGTVAFSDTKGQITACGAQTVTAGVATCSFTFTSAESDSITAVYSGDASYAGSTSTALTQTVTGSSTTPEPTKLTTSLSSSGSVGSGPWLGGRFVEVVSGTSVTDSATLSGVNASQATGTVTYTVYAWIHVKSRPYWEWAPVASGGTVTVTGGIVPSSNAVTLSPGIYEWQASYSGDALNNPSTSWFGSETEIVIPPPRCNRGSRWGLDPGCTAADL